MWRAVAVLCNREVELSKFSVDRFGDRLEIVDDDIVEGEKYHWGISRMHDVG